jgi:hypothetical protein
LIKHGQLGTDPKKESVGVVDVVTTSADQAKPNKDMGTSENVILDGVTKVLTKLYRFPI